MFPNDLVGKETKTVVLAIAKARCAKNLYGL